MTFELKTFVHGEVSSLDIESWLDRNPPSSVQAELLPDIEHIVWLRLPQRALPPFSMAGLSEPKPRGLISTQILTVAQCEKLLAAALKTGRRAGHAGLYCSGLYCGIRQLNSTNWNGATLIVKLD